MVKGVATFVGYLVLGGGSLWLVYALAKFIIESIQEEKRYKARIAALEIEKSNLTQKVSALSALVDESSKRANSLASFIREVSETGFEYELQPVVERSQEEWDGFVRSLEWNLREAARETLADARHGSAD